jgi:hypothetical protein
MVWAYFLHLYAHVIEDIPLVVTNPSAVHISHVVVHFRPAREDVAGEALFSVTWTIQDRNGQAGSIPGH